MMRVTWQAKPVNVRSISMPHRCMMSPTYGMRPLQKYYQFFIQSAVNLRLHFCDMSLPAEMQNVMLLNTRIVQKFSNLNSWPRPTAHCRGVPHLPFRYSIFTFRPRVDARDTNTYLKWRHNIRTRCIGGKFLNHLRRPVRKLTFNLTFLNQM